MFTDTQKKCCTLSVNIVNLITVYKNTFYSLIEVRPFLLNGTYEFCWETVLNFVSADQQSTFLSFLLLFVSDKKTLS